MARALDSGGAGSYVDDTGFTFISPSIYIGFTSVGARDRCGQVGTPIYNTTLAFDPTDISSVLPRTDTATCIKSFTREFDGSVVSMTVHEAPEPITQALTYSDVAQNCSSIFGYYWFSDQPSGSQAGDPCHPFLAIPTKVNQLQKEWNRCSADYNGGFYDPPKTLKQGQVLVPTTADPTPTADPGQSPTINNPPATTNDPISSTNNVPIPDLPVSTEEPVLDPPISASVPLNPTEPTPNIPEVPSLLASTTVQPDPPKPTINVPDVPIPPPASAHAETTTRPNPPQQVPPTTIITNPIPINADTVIQNPTNPSNRNPLVITLNHPTQQTTNNPSNPNLPSNPPDPLVLTLIPAVFPQPQNTANPQNPNKTPVAVPQASGTVVVIGTQTLQPGSAITVGGFTTTLHNGQITVTEGTELVLDPQGAQVVVDGTSTVNLPPAVPVQPTAAAVVITVGDRTITAARSSPIVVGTQTLFPGSAIIVDGTTLNLAPSGSQLVVGESTIALSPADPTSTDAPSTVTLDGTTLTANSLTQFVIESSTLTAGGTVTAAGTAYVLTTDTDGSTVLVAGTDGASSEGIVAPTATGADGNFTNGSMTGSATSTGSAPLEATGAAEALRLEWSLSGSFAVVAWALALG